MIPISVYLYLSMSFHHVYYDTGNRGCNSIEVKGNCYELRVENIWSRLDQVRKVQADEHVMQLNILKIDRLLGF